MIFYLKIGVLLTKMPSTKTTQKKTTKTTAPKETVKETAKPKTAAKPKTVEAPVKEAPVKSATTSGSKKPSSPTVQELKDELKKRGIAFPSKATKPHLLALSRGETFETESSSKKTTKRGKKSDNENKIKHPTSAYIYFSSDKRGDLRKEDPTMKQTEIAKRLGVMWKKLTDDEKKPYNEMAAKDKERYLREKAAAGSPSKGSSTKGTSTKNDEDESEDSPQVESSGSDEETEDLEDEE